MSNPAGIDLRPDHRRLVEKILHDRVPRATVWVFGSRATGRAGRYSDLDLAIDANRRLTLDETAILREAFEESDLPFKVDIVDWHAIGESFRKIIAEDRVMLAGTPAPGAS